MTTLNCNIYKLAKKKKEYNVKCICKNFEMPKNAKYIDTIYQPDKAFNIYVTNSGIYYASESKFYSTL